MRMFFPQIKSKLNTDLTQREKLKNLKANSF